MSESSCPHCGECTDVPGPRYGGRTFCCVDCARAFRDASGIAFTGNTPLELITWPKTDILNHVGAIEEEEALANGASDGEAYRVRCEAIRQEIKCIVALEEQEWQWAKQKRLEAAALLYEGSSSKK